MTSIVRDTRAGALQLTDTAPERRCAGCGKPAGDGRDALVGVLATATPPAGVDPADRRLHVAVCADCLAEALAILFGRRHVQHGGTTGDLQT